MTYKAFFLNQIVDGEVIRLAEYRKKDDALEMQTRAKFVFPDAEFRVDEGTLWTHEYDWAFFILWLFGFLLTITGSVLFGYDDAYKIGAAAQVTGILGAKITPVRLPIAVRNVHDLSVVE